VSDYLDRETLLVCYGLDEAVVGRVLRDTPLRGLEGLAVVEEDRLDELLTMIEYDDRFPESSWEEHRKRRQRSRQGHSDGTVVNDSFGDLTLASRGGAK
jgi:hypothetical protein